MNYFREDSLDILLIEPNVISHLNFNDPNYPQYITSIPQIKLISLTKEQNLYTELNKLLSISNNESITTEIIADEPNYIYEMMYKYTVKFDGNINEVGFMLNNNIDILCGNVVIFKSNTNTLKFENMSIGSLYNIIRNRCFTKIIIYDDQKLFEDEFFGETDKYAEKFFDNEQYKKLEFDFLLHNINIWYIESDTGDYVWKEIINKKIEKLFIFSIYNNVRCSLTMDEFNKIFKLSSVLQTFITPKKYLCDNTDEYNRKQINNKFNILNKVYNDFF